MPPYTEPPEQQGRREIVQALGVVLFAYFLSVLPPPAQGAVSRSLRATVLAPFLWVNQSMARARIQATESTTLQQEVDSLTAILSGNRNLAEENRRLRALLGLAARPGLDVRAASVLRPGTPGSEGTFMLDVGLEDGVRPGAPVLVAEGLVGVVREVADRAAIAMDWTNPDFRVSSMTMDGTQYGIIEPRRGVVGELDRLLWTGAPYFVELEAGAEVVTSGRGRLYPRGIPIGIIDGLAEVEEGWRRSYWVRPHVEPGSVTHVLVALWGGGEGRGGNLEDWWGSSHLDEGAFTSPQLPDLPAVDTVSRPPA